MKRKSYIKGLSYPLIILWIYAAGSKLWFYSMFVSQLERQPLPDWSIPVLSWLLPLAELVAVALLCFQRTLSKGFLLSFFSMFAFTLYVGLGLIHIYDKVPCSCGGILGKMGWQSHFIFNICFTIIAFIGWRLTKSNHENFVSRKTILT